MGKRERKTPPSQVYLAEACLVQLCLQMKNFPTYHMGLVNIPNAMLNNVYRIGTLVWVCASKNEVLPEKMPQ